jgi:hypothetical protein
LHAYENLNEASHVSFLHHGFIDSGNVAAHPFCEEAQEDRISTIREFKDEPVSPYAKLSYGLESDVVDRQLTLTAIAPTLVQQLFDSLGPEQRIEVSVKADSPAWRTRRMLEAMIKKERPRLAWRPACPQMASRCEPPAAKSSRLRHGRRSASLSGRGKSAFHAQIFIAFCPTPQPAPASRFSAA